MVRSWLISLGTRSLRANSFCQSSTLLVTFVPRASYADRGHSGPARTGVLAQLLVLRLLAGCAKVPTHQAPKFPTSAFAGKPALAVKGGAGLGHEKIIHNRRQFDHLRAKDGRNFLLKGLIDWALAPLGPLEDGRHFRMTLSQL